MKERGRHLGQLVVDLADGQLTADEADRALSHVAACPACAAELAACRAAQRAVAGSVDVLPDPALTARLLALAGPAPTPGERFRGPGVGQARPTDQVLSGELCSRRATRQRALALAGFVGLAAGAALFVVGGEPLVAPSTHPGIAQQLLAEAPVESQSSTRSALIVSASSELPAAPDGVPGAAGGVPARSGAALTWLREHRWTCPAGLPDGLVVTALQLREGGEEVLELDLARGNERTVVLEQRGRLDVGGFRDVVPQQIGGHQVYVLSRAPWHLVLESGGTVVTVVSEAPAELVDSLVAYFPASESSASVPVRVSRGWDVVTGAVR